ncbi:damage-control phosphatase ARMT1 isoform X2 [Apis florea]|nr:damage-control phosphatase ARMT1 isoform X2 [Apis florea]
MIGFISKLKNEIATNKTLKPMRLLPDDSTNDAEEWNKFLIKRTEIEKEIPLWFNTLWLYCECYMYRILAQELVLMKYIKTYDPFTKSKQNAFTNSLISIEILCSYVIDVISNKKNLSIMETKEEFMKFIKFNLWGNQCDLSLSAGADVGQATHPIQILKVLDKDILANNSEFIWNLLRKPDKNKLDINIIDIIIDNAGYELFTDFCLAAFLITIKFADKIRFYPKLYPWYISDASINDIHWTIDYMKNASNECLKKFANLIENYFKNNIWTIEIEPYWTGPYDLVGMKEHDPKLHAKLSDAKLIIFKGDLNYRKLVDDINWEYTTSFKKALRGFEPAPILAIRTVKSDVCVGIPPGVGEKLFEEDEYWMWSGKYGLIQITTAGNCQCLMNETY